MGTPEEARGPRHTFMFAAKTSELLDHLNETELDVEQESYSGGSYIDIPLEVGATLLRGLVLDKYDDFDLDSAIGNPYYQALAIGCINWRKSSILTDRLEFGKEQLDQMDQEQQLQAILEKTDDYPNLLTDAIQGIRKERFFQPFVAETMRYKYAKEMNGLNRLKKRMTCTAFASFDDLSDFMEQYYPYSSNRDVLDAVIINLYGKPIATSQEASSATALFMYLKAIFPYNQYVKPAEVTDFEIALERCGIPPDPTAVTMQEINQNNLIEVASFIGQHFGSINVIRK